MCNIYFHLIYVVVALINTVDNRRYDIEQECRKEYGTDLMGVLRHFRRSDDYVKILSMRTKEFFVFFEDTIYQSFDWNWEKMKAEVQADFGLNETDTPTTKTPTNSSTTHKIRALKSRYNNMRRQGSPAALLTPGVQKGLERIRRIDSHPKLNHFLTVEERNHYKNLGFKYVGDIIHSVIYAFRGDLSPCNDPALLFGSTLLMPEATAKTTPSTKHMLRHTVEDVTESTTTEKSFKKYMLVSRYEMP